MRLVKTTKLNADFFDKSSRLTKSQWKKEIEEGRVNGKIIGTTVLVDLDDFLSRDNFTEKPKDNQKLDLLA